MLTLIINQGKHYIYQKCKSQTSHSICKEINKDIKWYITLETNFMLPDKNEYAHISNFTLRNSWIYAWGPGGLVNTKNNTNVNQ